MQREDRAIRWQTGSSEENFIRSRVDLHNELERKLGDLNQLRDQYTYEIFAERGPEDPKVAELDHETNVKLGARITRDQFKSLASLASRIIPSSLPLLRRAFVVGGQRASTGILESIEEESMAIQVEMRNIESEVLDRTSANFEEVISKMRFVVSLLISGVDLEIEYFAFQIEECADVLCDLWQMPD